MTHASSSTSYRHDRSPLNALGSLDGGHGYEGYPSAPSTIAAAQGTPPSPPPPCNRIKSPVKLEPLHMGSGSLYALPASPLSGYVNGADASPIYPMMQPPNRVLSLCLWAEGMTMFIADVDTIASALVSPSNPLHDGPSTVFWVAVVACTVVMRPSAMPYLSWMTFASGARQLVVQDAFEMTWYFESYLSRLTPTTNIGASAEGAEMMTFFAPPCKCRDAFSTVVKTPWEAS